ncbi:MAG: hypothetical protein M1827_001326 [Pycnora praestabilis]|nr:MAG: hypothetical protein M1827_001326 [Pycnora praestabilis]
MDDTDSTMAPFPLFTRAGAAEFAPGVPMNPELDYSIPAADYDFIPAPLNLAGQERRNAFPAVAVVEEDRVGQAVHLDNLLTTHELLGEINGTVDQLHEIMIELAGDNATLHNRINEGVESFQTHVDAVVGVICADERAQALHDPTRSPVRRFSTADTLVEEKTRQVRSALPLRPTLNAGFFEMDDDADIDEDPIFELMQTLGAPESPLEEEALEMSGGMIGWVSSSDVNDAESEGSFLEIAPIHAISQRTNVIERLNLQRDLDSYRIESESGVGGLRRTL